jgi:hypothetical protein
MASLVRPEHF